MDEKEKYGNIWTGEGIGMREKESSSSLSHHLLHLNIRLTNKRTTDKW